MLEILHEIQPNRIVSFSDIDSCKDTLKSVFILSALQVSQKTI